ncbi:2-dehydro-3-deoxy-D-gluconate 5-dehydrogenase KduD [Simiduia curdlanivorans]|uniref:2-dehydro-3-deoxy-D-gluconate 5-dehydrogenase KduD n=1 Tax=Simiduia curdlanivorans TaxID=1492769 RepID=A0ABV8V7S6_9GAMM|nr:2-dehydro-3-deoxy-D-gluconate 5-dehydrogenase KduD [Simiduia curdlanivorans]MDN3639720.1 2-dehydro-3-deoxy-D-gluconate 5-dehydrogenase KduD [Simiduia curdlanivorans]
MILDAFNLRGKVAIVTGASRGLGRGIALALAEAGADIVGVGVSDSSETGRDITALGRKYLQVTADLTDSHCVGGIVAQARAAFGRIDILVNNAGTIRRDDFLEFSEEDWDAVMDLNLKTLFFFSQAVAKVFIEQGSGGKIIHIASMLSYQGGVRVASYTASKSGVKGLTMLMANEMAAHGINVNAIAPGYMATDNTEQLRNDPKRNTDILGRIPAGRWGNPSDLGGAVVFLASAAADYVHGFTLAVDGGWLAR